MRDKDFISSDYEWRRSTFCASGACVLVGLSGDGNVLVSDCKNPDMPPLEYIRSHWEAEIADQRNGDPYVVERAADDSEFVWAWNGRLLTFTGAEVKAFRAGVLAGEFDYDKLSSGDEAGSGFRGVARSGHAATGAGAIAVPPVPVAAQPPAVTVFDLEADAALVREALGPRGVRSVHRTALIAVSTLANAGRIAGRTATLAGLGVDQIVDIVRQYGEACKAGADYRGEELLDAIRVALVPATAVKPEPSWGSGPLVEHVTETPADLEGGAR